MLRLESVGLELGGRVIFSDVNLEVKKGESVAIIGPSGAGKTLLLKVICGLVSATRGRIFLFGKEIDKLGYIEKLDVFKKIGFSFQQSALFDFLDLKSILGFPLKEGLRLRDEEIYPRVMSLAKELGLEDAVDKMANELSGGMKKRVSLGRALIHQPEILFCDDPTSGLDPITSSQISDLILRLKERLRFSLVLVSNELKVIRNLSERVYLLYQGRLKEVDKKELQFGADREWSEIVRE